MVRCALSVMLQMRGIQMTTTLELLGSPTVTAQRFAGEQSEIVLAATTLQDWVEIRKLKPKSSDEMAQDEKALVRSHLVMTLELAREPEFALPQLLNNHLRQHPVIHWAVVGLKPLSDNSRSIDVRFGPRRRLQLGYVDCCR